MMFESLPRLHLKLVKGIYSQVREPAFISELKSHASSSLAAGRATCAEQNSSKVLDRRHILALKVRVWLWV
jgi:hypothetical protein